MSATPRQLQFLAVLKRSPNASLRVLGEKFGTSHVTAVQMLDRVRKAGFATPKPKRELTAKGLAALRTAPSDLRESLSAVA